MPKSSSKFCLKSVSLALGESELNVLLCCATCLLEFPFQLYHQHLQWCSRKNYREPLTRCPYNRRHSVVDSELKFHLVTCCNRQSFEDENSSHRALPNLLAFTLSATVSARKAIVKQSVEVNHSVDQNEVNGGLGRPDAMQSEVEVSTEEVGTAVVNKSPGPFDYGDDNNFGAVGVDENNNFAR